MHKKTFFLKTTIQKRGQYHRKGGQHRRNIQEEGFHHGMTPQHLKRIRELEKENSSLKQLLAEKELENKLKGELLKKK